MSEQITKRHVQALERVFAKEVEAAVAGGFRAPILQSKAKIYEELESMGLVRKETHLLGRDRFGAIEVSGWGLTLAGNAAYCFTCADADEP